MHWNRGEELAGECVGACFRSVCVTLESGSFLAPPGRGILS